MALLWAYNANVNSLIHLYVIGVFTAFTLSQAGMVRYWLRTRDPGWAYRAPVNVVGAAATGLVTVIVIWTKFAEGAWLVIVAIPLLVLMFLGINRHYRRFGRRLQAGVDAVRLAGDPKNQVLLWVEAIDVATEGALWYARRIARGKPIRALLAPGRHTDPGIRPRWWEFAQEEPRLETLPVDEGRMQALLEEVWRLPRGESDFVTVVVPEQFRRASLLSAAGRTSFRLKLRLRLRAGRRRHRRARRYGPPDPRAPHAEQARRPRAARKRPRGGNAGDHLCQRARRGRCPCGVLRVRRRGGLVVPQRSGTGRG